MPHSSVKTRTQKPMPTLQKRLRFAAAVVATVIVFITVAGCSSTPYAPPTPTSTSQTEPTTCGEFLKLSATQRVSIYAHSNRVRIYSANDVENVSRDELYSRVCVNLPSTDDLGNLLGDAQLPSCSLYQTLSAGVQQKWLDAIRAEQSYGLKGPAQGPQLVDACNAFNAGNMIAASNYIKTFGPFMQWDTTSKLGYREHLVLGVQPVLKGKNIEHPINNKLIAGSACGFDSTKDAAVPLQLFILNTTKTQSQPMATKVDLDIINGESLTTTAYLEVKYSDGPVCSPAASVYGSAATVDLKFPDATTSGGNLQAAIFVIVKNYFSPRYSAGAVNELASYRLRSDAQVNTDDPIVQLTPATMRLDGSK